VYSQGLAEFPHRELKGERGEGPLTSGEVACVARPGGIGVLAVPVHLQPPHGAAASRDRGPFKMAGSSGKRIALRGR